MTTRHNPHTCDAFNRNAQWFRPIPDPEVTSIGASWTLLTRIYTQHCNFGVDAAVQDDFGNLVPVPYTPAFFNQPEH